MSAEDRAEQTRAAIVDAAEHAFRTHGYEATTMGSVAALAGVSPRSLYRHYGSKGALFAETTAVRTEDFLEEFAANVRRMPLREAVLASVQSATFEASEENRAMLQTATTDNEVSRYWHSAYQRMLPSIVDILREAAGPEAPPASDIVWDTRAATLIAAFSSAYRRWAATPGANAHDLVVEAVDTVMPILEPMTAHVTNSLRGGRTAISNQRGTNEVSTRRGRRQHP